MKLFYNLNQVDPYLLFYNRPIRINQHDDKNLVKPKTQRSVIYEYIL